MIIEVVGRLIFNVHFIKQNLSLRIKFCEFCARWKEIFLIIFLSHIFKLRSFSVRHETTHKVFKMEGFKATTGRFSTFELGSLSTYKFMLTSGKFSRKLRGRGN